MFAGRPWPLAFGAGVGVGMGFSNCQHDFMYPNLHRGQLKKVRFVKVDELNCWLTVMVKMCHFPSDSDSKHKSTANLLLHSPLLVVYSGPLHFPVQSDFPLGSGPHLIHCSVSSAWQLSSWSVHPFLHSTLVCPTQSHANVISVATDHSVCYAAYSKICTYMK